MPKVIFYIFVKSLVEDYPWSLPRYLLFAFLLFFATESCVPKGVLLVTNCSYQLRKSHPFLYCVSFYLMYNSEAIGSFAFVLYTKLTET